MYKSIIFDMDGVLIDSEPIYKEANSALFKSIGIEVDDSTYNTFIGIGAEKMWEQLKKQHNLPLAESEYVAMDRKQKLNWFSTVKMSAMPGVIEILTFLKQQGIKLAVASSSPQKNVHLVLNAIGAYSFFDSIVCGDQVTEGKPNPSIFLKAAELLDSHPSNCIVLEDSKNGITAGNRAGMTTVGYLPFPTNQDLSHSKHIIKSFNELKEIIKF